MGEVLARLPPAVPLPPDTEERVRVAIIGRPNVGKSSLVNALLGEKKRIVDAAAGTTRDSIDTPLESDGTKFLLIDTAGLRRKSHVSFGVEYWSALRSARAVRQSDVAVVVLDATQGISEQDVKIAAESVEQGASVILCVNKWDAIEKDHDTARRFEERISWHFNFLADAPLVYCSALTGRKIGRILPEAARLAGIRQRRIPTAQVNELLRKIVEKNPPPSARSAQLTRVLYGTQVSNRPPTFAVFTNRPENVEGHYARFLRNTFKEEFGFEGTPVKVVVRKREGKEPE
jgi:GTP-binding protein